MIEARLGWGGLPAFLLAFAGAAILAGPGGAVAGIGGFVIGAGILLIGLAAASLLLLWRDRRFAMPASCWIVAAFLLAPTGPDALAGVLTGAGFLAAVYGLWPAAVSAPGSSSRVQTEARS